RVIVMMYGIGSLLFFFSSRRRHTRFSRDWSSDVCSSDLLSADGEPLIWAGSNRFGAILENVVMDADSRTVDFDDDSVTENTRSSDRKSVVEGKREARRERRGHEVTIRFIVNCVKEGERGT